MRVDIDDEWLRPIDLENDSYTPELIREELARRHALYLREAQRLVLERQTPDAGGLAEGIRGETRRYLDSSPWLADARLMSVVEEAEAGTIASLSEMIAAAGPKPPPTSTTPPRRMTLQPAATIVGTLPIRKARLAVGVELSWDPEAKVNEWQVRIGTRPDPRQPYRDGEPTTLAAGTTSYTVTLDETPRRIQITGHARDGRVIRRATISALTSGNSGAQWKQQATAS